MFGFATTLTDISEEGVGRFRPSCIHGKVRLFSEFLPGRLILSIGRFLDGDTVVVASSSASDRRSPGREYYGLMRRRSALLSKV